VHESTAADWIAFASLLVGIGLVGIVCGSLPG
jgi:hypothetical protein